MSMPSTFLVTSVFSHFSSPVAASRAKALVDVPPTTMPPPMATPLGPVVALSKVFSHFCFPVARSTAITFELMSCRYTVSVVTIGFEAKTPNVLLPVKGKDQAFSRVPMLDALMSPATARVLSKLPLGVGNAEAASVTSAGVPGGNDEADSLPPPHPAAVPITTVKSAAPMSARDGRLPRQALVSMGLRCAIVFLPRQVSESRQKLAAPGGPQAGTDRSARPGTARVCARTQYPCGLPGRRASPGPIARSGDASPERVILTPPMTGLAAACREHVRTQCPWAFGVHRIARDVRDWRAPPDRLRGVRPSGRLYE